MCSVCARARCATSLTSASGSPKLHYEEARCIAAQDRQLLLIPDQRVRVAFLGDDRQLLELVEPLDPDSGVGRFVSERGRPTLHHVCYVVDDLAGTLAGLAHEGVELIDRAPRRGAEGDVAFIHPRSSGGVLIELIDRATIRESVP